MKKAIQTLLALTLISGISGCNPGYYHEPVTTLDYPLLEEFTKEEQLAIEYCIGQHDTMPSEVDCSIDGKVIKLKIINNIVRLKTHIKEQKQINERHNQANEQ